MNAGPPHYMEFCPECQSLMRLQPAGGTIRYQCPRDQTVVDGGPESALLTEGGTRQQDPFVEYRHLINAAPFDPVNARVDRPCPDCGVPFLTFVRLGDNETVIYRCTCGHTSTPGTA